MQEPLVSQTHVLGWRGDNRLVTVVSFRKQMECFISTLCTQMSCHMYNQSLINDLATVAVATQIYIYQDQKTVIQT